MTVKNALTQVRLQGASAEIKSATVQCFKTIMVDRAGFEPAASALRTRRSCQTDLPAHFCASFFSAVQTENKGFWY